MPPRAVANYEARVAPVNALITFPRILPLRDSEFMIESRRSSSSAPLRSLFSPGFGSCSPREPPRSSLACMRRLLTQLNAMVRSDKP